MTGISFVVPVHNGAPWLRATLDAIYSQDDGRPIEVIVVDDGSRDNSGAILADYALTRPLRIVRGEGRGAAAAINVGLRAARHPLVAQVDQDVVLSAGWMERLVREFDDPAVAAVQGYYVCDRSADWCARAMGFDLEQRYSSIDGADTDQVCTGNAVYRATPLRQVGLFDETLGYGYDNDISYRLRAAGHRLRLCRTARSTHRWREGMAGYLAQQYGFGYGRVDLVAKHPARLSGDVVSPFSMMVHPLLMLVALAALAAAGVLRVSGGPWWTAVAVAAVLGAGLAAERMLAGVRAAREFRNWTPLAFPLLHLLRDVVWVIAILMWLTRRAAGAAGKPSHSMQPRPVTESPPLPD